MTRLRYDHVLVGTALALILAVVPVVSLAQDDNKTAPLPDAKTPAQQKVSEASLSNPAAMTEPTLADECWVRVLDPLGFSMICAQHHRGLNHSDNPRRPD
jgi:hypothetical protein